jgi:hypothetical protein
MILRLPADADLNGAIVSGVDVPLERLPDHVVLAIAAEDRRVLVTHDVSSMPDHFREYVRDYDSPVIILIPQILSIGKAIECTGPVSLSWTMTFHSRLRRRAKSSESDAMCLS